MKLCKICGSECPPGRHVYCSSPCQDAGHKEKVRQNHIRAGHLRTARLLPIPCAFCGQEFKPYSVRAINCSAGCRDKRLRQQKKLSKNPVNRCQFCGEKTDYKRKTCAMPDCQKSLKEQNRLRARIYQRMTRTGTARPEPICKMEPSPVFPIQSSLFRAEIERFLARGGRVTVINPQPASDCWIDGFEDFALGAE